jgi:hypothetical protein
MRLLLAFLLLAVPAQARVAIVGDSLSVGLASALKSRGIEVDGWGVSGSGLSNQVADWQERIHKVVQSPS